MHALLLFTINNNSMKLLVNLIYKILNIIVLDKYYAFENYIDKKII